MSHINMPVDTVIRYAIDMIDGIEAQRRVLQRRALARERLRLRRSCVRRLFGLPVPTTSQIKEKIVKEIDSDKLVCSDNAYDYHIATSVIYEKQYRAVMRVLVAARWCERHDVPTMDVSFEDFMMLRCCEETVDDQEKE